MKKIILAFFAVIFVIGTLVSCSNSTPNKLNPNEPVTIKVWNYYNGANKKTFDNKIIQFNQSVGKEKGIIVEAMSFTNVNSLYEGVNNSINKKIGAKELPNIVQVYYDYAKILANSNLIIDLNKYFSDSEVASYIPNFIEDGMINDKLYVLPIAKSTEIMLINATDWEKYASISGTKIEDLSTIEGLTKIASDYHEKTGEALFGRDAFANYMLIGGQQLGLNYVKIVDGKTVLDLDKQAVRKLWDNYYIPLIKGDFAAKGKFRSDDIRTKDIISMVGSSTSISFFPKNVTINDKTSYSIDTIIAKAPMFKDAKSYFVSQGAGMSILKTDEKLEYASSVFLKWFTSNDVNTDFALRSGYIPVTIASNDSANIKSNLSRLEASKSVSDASIIASDILKGNYKFKTIDYPEAISVRNVLDTFMSDTADNDYKEIVAQIKNGGNSETIYAKYLSDDNFDQWYLSFGEALQNALVNNHE